MKGLVTEWLRNQHPGIKLSDELLDRSEPALDPMFRSKYPKLLAFPLPLPEADVRLVHDTDLPLTLQVKICLMDSGCGLCDVSLAVKESSRQVSFKQLHDLLKLANEQHGEKYRIKRGDQLDSSTETVYGLFLESLHDFLDSFKEAPDPLNEKRLVQWGEVRKGKTWGQQNYKVAWLDFILADFSKEREYQQPYLVIELLANEELYSEFFLANPDEVDASSIRQKRLRISKELSSVLFREVIFENIDYLDPTFPGWADLTRGEMSVTTNLNLNSQLFLTVHYRSTLLVSNAGLPEGRNPFRFIGPSALTMLCFVRLRWYALVTINGLLDDLLRKVACLPADEAWSTEVNRITKDIMKWRMRLGHFLEDPTVYHWGGGSLPQAFKIAQQAFSLERLERGALQKFAVIDRAIADFVRSRSIEALQ